MNVPSQLRSFLEFPRRYLHHLFRFLQHAFLFVLQSARQRSGLAKMAAPVDSMAPSDVDELLTRQMVHLKTKEECRLGNETIQVWTVELPSKHAEGILKYFLSLSYVLGSY